MQTLIGKPLNYSYNLISLITKFIESKKDVKKAYLACIQYPDQKYLPKILIGLDVVDDISGIILELQSHLNKNRHSLNEIEFTDAINSQFKDYFLKINPFYERC